LSVFEKSTTLVTLFIKENPFTEIDLSPLINIPSLENILVERTKLSPDDEKTFFDILP
jgi:hypothetical protein